MPAPPGDPPRAPKPPRPSTPATQSGDSAREDRRNQRKLPASDAQASGSHGYTAISDIFTPSGGSISGSLDGSQYGEGFVIVTACATLGGTPPSGVVSVLADDGTGDGQGAFGNASPELQSPCSASGICGAETVVVVAAYVPDDPDADLSGVTLNLTVRSKVL